MKKSEPPHRAVGPSVEASDPEFREFLAQSNKEFFASQKWAYESHNPHVYVTPAGVDLVFVWGGGDPLEIEKLEELQKLWPYTVVPLARGKPGETTLPDEGSLRGVMRPIDAWHYSDVVARRKAAAISYVIQHKLPTSPPLR